MIPCRGLLAPKNPETGVISYTYDLNGNVVQKTSPKPNQTNSATTSTNFCYDLANRVTSKVYNATACPPTSPVATYTYDQGTNGIGRRTGMTDTAGSATWTYDSVGRIVFRGKVTANVTKTTSYIYNQDGSVKTITYPSARTVNYTYGGAGRVCPWLIQVGRQLRYICDLRSQGGPATYTNGFVSGGFTGITTADAYNNRLQPVFDLIFESDSKRLEVSATTSHSKTTISLPPCPTFAASATGDNETFTRL